ncbi:hypothetical protein ACFFMN_04700 [Planobispora siamensis]|uniref:Uncharacterized protein n=1 Tax=Planobispora siamensis TaxID=936338 RepID=A0A8J3SFX8_9ACTN|nr:hypothetical protein [Planobispora siamensis]GIH92340.1 hypothetical protein Psi01_29700 [Planobispora siamensis]
MNPHNPEPPTTPVRWDTTAPSPAPRRRWLVPAVAGVTALAATGGVALYMVNRPGETRGPASSAASPAVPAAASPSGPIDACATIDSAESDRLVPQAKITEATNDRRTSEFPSITWSCSWQNLDYSFGEYSRSREISVEITQHLGHKGETADTVSRKQYGIDLQSSRYSATHPLKDSYFSDVVPVAGAGDEAHSQYTWYKGKSQNAFGQGFSRVGDLTIKVKYQAGQVRKDLPLFTTTGKKSVNEENALREIKLLLTQVSQSAAAWRQGRPYARATPSPTPTPTPTVTPTPVPIAMPKACAAVEPIATPLIPGAKAAFERTQDGGKTITTCRWNNREIPAAKGRLGLRTVYISITQFTNRAGSPDFGAAKQYYIDLRAKAKQWEGSGFQGLFYYKVNEPEGWGDGGHYQYRKNRTPSAHVGVADSAVRIGTTVIEVTHGGSERPKNTPINYAKSVLMPQKQAVAGVLPVTEAIVKGFKENGLS